MALVDLTLLIALYSLLVNLGGLFWLTTPAITRFVFLYYTPERLFFIVRRAGGAGRYGGGVPGEMRKKTWVLESEVSTRFVTWRRSNIITRSQMEYARG